MQIGVLYMLVFQILLLSLLCFLAGVSIQFLEHSILDGAYDEIFMQTHDGHLRHFVCHVAIIFSLMSHTLSLKTVMLYFPAGVSIQILEHRSAHSFLLGHMM